jgi:hypothetical protein
MKKAETSASNTVQRVSRTCQATNSVCYGHSNIRHPPWLCALGRGMWSRCQPVLHCPTNSLILRQQIWRNFPIPPVYQRLPAVKQCVSTSRQLNFWILNCCFLMFPVSNTPLRSSELSILSLFLLLLGVIMNTKLSVERWNIKIQFLRPREKKLLVR